LKPEETITKTLFDCLISVTVTASMPDSQTVSGYHQLRMIPKFICIRWF